MGDSRLVIEQLKGNFKIRSPKLANIHAKIRVLLMKFTNLNLKWIEREKNKEADQLCNIAYLKYTNRRT